jgi:hypothetical protein
MTGIPEAERGNLVQNLDMSFMSIDMRGHIIPKTPMAGYIATHTYLMEPDHPKAILEHRCTKRLW